MVAAPRNAIALIAARLIAALLLVCTPLLLTSPQAARLELRPSSAAGEQLFLDVGDEIDVDLWVDSESDLLSGAAVFVSFDPQVFALASADRSPATLGFQPFASGTFLNNGEVYRNDLLPEDDPAAAATGLQLDFSVVRAADQGEGPVASFRLRALAPAGQSVVRIDESGVRETRVFLPDGSHAPFRFITPLRAVVRGITLADLPQRLVLARGTADVTSLRLSELVHDPLYSDAEITWSFGGTSELGLSHDEATGVLQLTAPADRSAWEQLIITATNPDGQSAADTVDVFVAAPPQLLPQLEPILLSEDVALNLTLDAWVQDDDTPSAKMAWSATASPTLTVGITGPPHVATITPKAEWSGSGSATFTVVDDFGFADTVQVGVSVEPVNDPPVLAFAPNVRLTSGRQDSSLVISALVSDLEDGDPTLRWSGAQQVTVEERGGRLIIGHVAQWIGTEQIVLQVTDSGGLTASAPLTVTVVASLPPSIVDAPAQHGVAAGGSFVLQLDNLVTDPDDPDHELTWKISGQSQLTVLLSSGRAVRVDAPSGFAGVEMLTLTATDPTGGAASFGLQVFAAPLDGTPLLTELPQITVPLGGADSSLDLDDFVYDLDDDDQQIDFYLTARTDVDLQVDPLTHTLTVTPADQAYPGIINVDVRAVDPAGNEALQTLRIMLTGEAPQPAFVLSPVAPISLAADLSKVLELDEMVDGDVERDKIVWTVAGQTHLDVSVNPETRALSVSALDSQWSGTEAVILGASYPGQPVQMISVSITVTPPEQPTSLPRLSALPTIQMPPGSLDQSLNLDDYVLDVDPATVTWEVAGQLHVDASIDPATHLLSLVAAAGWSGQETLAISGYYDDGNSIQGIVVINITSTLPILELRATTEVALFAGTAELRLSAPDLILGDVDPASLTWVASGPDEIAVAYDDLLGELVLTPTTPWQNAAIVTVMAEDAAGAQASGHVLAQVYPIDGSVGTESPDFQLAIVANPVQPDYVNIYLVGAADLPQRPVLRLRQNDWQSLALETLIPGIWQTQHVDASATQTALEFVALTIDATQQVLRSSVVLQR
jgi:hypothetical protein